MPSEGPSLGALSREDRAVAVVAATLAGRAAPEVLGYLSPGRAAPLVRAAEAYLAVPAALRLTLLQRQARRLGAAARIDPRSLHPQRHARLCAAAPPAVSRVLQLLLGGVSARSPAPHPAAASVVRLHLEERLAATPWADEIAASPEPVARLVRASAERLLRVAEALGAPRFASVVAQSPPAVAAWLAQRLPPEWDDDLARVEPADPAESLAALDRLTRTHEGDP